MTNLGSAGPDRVCCCRSALGLTIISLRMPLKKSKIPYQELSYVSSKPALVGYLI